ncbi:hypothetical protein, partial [Pseudomonas syringae group genomosp. 7]|uniref:hypothetical protein n=1 Tax=Pseudomonas syringae group genomosp. 7 TaxID=251699 RepID=UPI00376FF618
CFAGGLERQGQRVVAGVVVSQEIALRPASYTGVLIVQRSLLGVLVGQGVLVRVDGVAGGGLDCCLGRGGLTARRVSDFGVCVGGEHVGRECRGRNLE